MQKVMVMDAQKARTLSFGRPFDALREVYENFSFSPEKEINNCVIRAVVDVKGRERGGPVEYFDFKASINPIYHHVKRILQEANISFTELQLIEVRIEEKNVVFKFTLK